MLSSRRQRIVDLTLPIERGMAGIPTVPFYSRYPVTVQAVTVIDEAQRAFLRGQGVDVVADEEARGVMNTVFTLNSHVGTHIDAPRHFVGEGTAVDEVALGGLVMREAVVLDLSHGSPARTPWTRSRSSLRSVGSRPIASCARSSSSPSGSSRRSAIADRARPGSCPISRRAGPILPSVSVCSARGARSTASRRCSA